MRGGFRDRAWLGSPLRRSLGEGGRHGGSRTEGGDAHRGNTDERFACPEHRGVGERAGHARPRRRVLGAWDEIYPELTADLPDCSPCDGRRHTYASLLIHEGWATGALVATDSG
jgi:hypothetical protein